MIAEELRKFSSKQVGLLMIFGFIIGILTGTVSSLLHIAVEDTADYIEHWHEHISGSKSFYLTFLLPGIGAGLGAWFLESVFKDKDGHGVESIIRVSTRDGNLHPKLLFTRLIASFLTVSSGGSTGLEGPIVTTGGAIGSNFGRLSKLSQRQKNLLIGCGVAGACAGIFNAPLTGMIFALEVVLLEWSAIALLPIIVTAVTSTALSQFILHQKITFPTEFSTLTNLELLLCVGLGLCCAIGSLILSRVYFKCALFVKKKSYPKYFTAFIGGSMVGIIALFYPEVLGIGYESIQKFLDVNSTEGVLNYQSSFTIILGFLFFKLVATVLTLASGGTGGFFAPSFVLGSGVGIIYGKVLARFDLTSAPNAYVLMGMAGFLSALMHAPLTAIFMVLEATQGFGLILPVMITAGTAMLISQYFEPGSIYTRDLVIQGELARRGSDEHLLRNLQIKDILDDDCLIVEESLLLRDFLEIFKNATRNYFPAVDEDNKCIGVIFLDDIRSYLFDTDLYDIMTMGSVARYVPIIVPDEPPISAMHKFQESEYWSLPVVDSDGVFLGMLSKSSLFDHYRRELIVSTDS